MILLMIASLRIIWTFEGDLVEIKGQVRDARMYQEFVTYEDGRFPFKTDKRRRDLEIIFYLTGKPYTFSMAKSIDASYFGDDKQYTDIIRKLKHYDTVSVFIDEDDVDEEKPYIYAISTGDKDILSLEDTKSPKRTEFLTYGILLLTIGGVIYFFRATD